MSIYGDPVWYQDLGILFGRRTLEFWPSADMTFTERLNSVVRFVVYATLGLYASKRDPKYVLYGGAAIVILSLAYATRGEAYTPEGVGARASAPCTKPTADNPFANVLVTDYKDNPNRAPACEASKVAADIEEKFNQRLFRNVSDVYSLENSQRMFYSMPSTTIPNDQKAFAEFAYNTKPNCKTDPSRCTGYN